MGALVIGGSIIGGLLQYIMGHMSLTRLTGTCFVVETPITSW